MNICIYMKKAIIISKIVSQLKPIIVHNRASNMHSLKIRSWTFNTGYVDTIPTYQVAKFSKLACTGMHRGGKHTATVSRTPLKKVDRRKLLRAHSSGKVNTHYSEVKDWYTYYRSILGSKGNIKMGGSHSLNSTSYWSYIIQYCT